MKKIRITITVPDECPEGTALLFALAEVLKDVPAIAALAGQPGKRVTALADMEDGEVRVCTTWVKV